MLGLLVAFQGAQGFLKARESHGCEKERQFGLTCACASLNGPYFLSASPVFVESFSSGVRDSADLDRHDETHWETDLR